MKVVNDKELRAAYHIVCEGKNSEPCYFNFLKKQLHVKDRSLQITITERAGQTLGVVESAINKRNEIEKNKQRKQISRLKTTKTQRPIHFWAVFDYDGVNNFDEAIRLAKDSEIKAGYSNPCFELWYLLHFRDSGKSLTQKEADKELKSVLKNKGFSIEDLKDIKSKETAQKIAEMILNMDKEEQEAIKRAERLAIRWQNENPPLPYHQQNPSTRVHILVEKLRALAPKS